MASRKMKAELRYALMENGKRFVQDLILWMKGLHLLCVGNWDFHQQVFAITYTDSITLPLSCLSLASYLHSCSSVMKVIFVVV